MQPVQFPEANTRFGPPPDLAESQCRTIYAHVTKANGGSCDGATVVVVAWKPTIEELAKLNSGGLIYLSCSGGLPPHFLCTDFHAATHPA
jgi:hypothetical protein